MGCICFINHQSHITWYGVFSISQNFLLSWDVALTDTGAREDFIQITPPDSQFNVIIHHDHFLVYHYDNDALMVMMVMV